MGDRRGGNTLVREGDLFGEAVLDDMDAPATASLVELGGANPSYVWAGGSLSSGDLMPLDGFDPRHGGHDAEVHRERGSRSGGGGSAKNGGGGDSDVLHDYRSGPEDGYNIQLEFHGKWSASLQGAFMVAADWISSTITADLVGGRIAGEFIDDLKIDATLRRIDGPGGILGQSGPTWIRSGAYDYHPIAASMEFDVADARTYQKVGLWDDIVLHEMLHGVGVGTIWGFHGLVDAGDASHPVFTGAATMLAYRDLFPELSGGVALPVPVEETGGAGTALSHWDDRTNAGTAVFGDELMTGYLDGDNYLSGLTVASLVDIGYSVDGSAYDQRVELDLDSWAIA